MPHNRRSRLAPYQDTPPFCSPTRILLGCQAAGTSAGEADPARPCPARSDSRFMIFGEEQGKSNFLLGHLDCGMLPIFHYWTFENGIQGIFEEDSPIFNAFIHQL